MQKINVKATAAACMICCCSGMHDLLLQRHGPTWIPLLMQDTIICRAWQLYLHVPPFCSCLKLLLQFAALGQHGLCFQPELHDVNDSAREDIRCCIDGEPLEPSEIKASEFYPTTKDPDGIHSNSAGLSKVRHVSQVAFPAWRWHVCKAKHQYPKLSKVL